MQIFHIISVVVPLVIATTLPYYFASILGKKERSHRWILYLACALFFISWYLPSPLIHGEDTSFVTHFVGGGIFTGLLWVYLKCVLKWRAHWIFELASIFALVSALGAVNELAELFMVEFGIAKITLHETNWDILANTLGAFVLYIGYKAVGFMNDSRN